MEFELKLGAAVLAATFAGVASAFDPIGYVKMSANDPAGAVTSFNGAGMWDSGAKPEKGKKYLIPSGKQMYGPSTGTLNDPYVYTFEGDQLVVQGTFWPLGPNYSQNILTVEDCILLGGGKFSNGGTRPFLYGKCTVLESSASKPFQITSGMTTAKGQWVAEFGADLYGDSGQVIQFVNTSAAGTTWYQEYALVGSQENYLGSYDIGSRLAVQIGGYVPGSIVVRSGGTYRTWFYHGHSPETKEHYDVFSDPTVGSLTVENGGILEVSATNVLTVANLTLKAGANISIKSATGTNGQIVVTGRLTVEGPVNVSLSRSYNTEIGVPPRYSFIRLAPGASGTLRPEDFVLPAPTISDAVGTLPHIYYQAEEGEDGAVRLVEGRREIVKLLRAEEIDEKAYSALICASNKKDLAYWSDGREPHAGADYLATTGYGINIPQGTGILAFGGESLTLSGGANIQSGNAKGLTGLSFKELSFGTGTPYLQIWSGKSNYAHGLSGMCVTGGVFSVCGTIRLTPYGNFLLDVKSDLAGSGMVYARGLESAGNDGPRSNVEFSGNNTNWTGKLLVTLVDNTRDRPSSQWGNTVPNEGVYTTFYASDGKNLGGPMEGFTYDGITVNQLCKFAVTGDVVLDQANRGLFVERMARFQVDEGKTFTVANPFTLRGLLRKEGDGVLALGGKLRFAKDNDLGNDPAPEAGTNLVVVKAGGLRVDSAVAADGAAITFEAGSYLVANIGATAETALRSVREGSALASEAAGEKIPVRLKGEVVEGTTVLCTSKDANLKFAVSRPKSFSANVTRSEADEDGVYTYTLTLEHAGVLIMVR